MFTLGLDGLDITINTSIKLEQNQYIFKNQTGEELGNLVAVKRGYKLHICLPKMIRNSNSVPFGVSDYNHLSNVLEFIKNNVLNLFKGESTEITIQACEVNSTEDYLNRVTKAYNEIDKLIGKLSTSKDYIRACNEISAFAQVIGKDSTEVLKLKHKLKNRVSKIMTEYDDKLEEIKHDISAFQSIEITDTPEEARDLQQLATTKMYEYMMQLNRDENTNRRLVGNWIKGKQELSRVDAVALTQLSALPAYEKLFKPLHREILGQKIKKPEQIEHEKAIAPMIEQKKQELSRTYMDSFMLRQALQRVTLIDGEKLETDKKIMTPKLQEGENLFD